MSTAVEPSRDKTSPRSWVSEHRVLSIFLVGIVLFAVLAGYFSSTVVSGIELNPVDWKVRRFWFRRDPFTNTRFTGIYHSSVTLSGIWNEAPSKTFSNVDPIISGSLKAAGNPKQWDVVRISDGVESIGPAIVWYELLQTYDSDYDLHWVEWSSDNPKFAAVLWPAVQDLTRHGLYADIPAMLELTTTELDLADFELKVAELALRSLLDFCAESEDQEKITSAAISAAEYGDHPDLKLYLR